MKIEKKVMDIIEIGKSSKDDEKVSAKKLTGAERERLIEKLTAEMKEAARMMEFEYAAVLRDQIIELRGNGI